MDIFASRISYTTNPDGNDITTQFAIVSEFMKLRATERPIAPDWYRLYKGEGTTRIYYFKDSIYYFDTETIRRLPPGAIYGVYNEYPGTPGVYQLMGGDVTLTVRQGPEGYQTANSLTAGNTQPYTHNNIKVQPMYEMLNLGWSRVAIFISTTANIDLVHKRSHYNLTDNAP